MNAIVEVSEEFLAKILDILTFSDTKLVLENGIGS